MAGGPGGGWLRWSARRSKGGFQRDLNALRLRRIKVQVLGKYMISRYLETLG